MPARIQDLPVAAPRKHLGNHPGSDITLPVQPLKFIRAMANQNTVVPGSRQHETFRHEEDLHLFFIVLVCQLGHLNNVGYKSKWENNSTQQCGCARTGIFLVGQPSFSGSRALKRSTSYKMHRRSGRMHRRHGISYVHYLAPDFGCVKEHGKKRETHVSSPRYHSPSQVSVNSAIIRRSQGPLPFWRPHIFWFSCKLNAVPGTNF